jgi:hypothetical protein
MNTSLCSVKFHVLRYRILTPLLILSVTTRAGAEDPFTGWSEGVGTAAASLAASAPGPALEAARAAARLITTGEAGARARLLAGLALLDLDLPAPAAAELSPALLSLPVTLAPYARARA